MDNLQPEQILQGRQFNQVKINYLSSKKIMSDAKTELKGILLIVFVIIILILVSIVIRLQISVETCQTSPDLLCFNDWKCPDGTLPAKETKKTADDCTVKTGGKTPACAKLWPPFPMSQ